MRRVANWWKVRVFCDRLRVGKREKAGGGDCGGSRVMVFGSFIKMIIRLKA